jgi:hypothetical protein
MSSLATWIAGHPWRRAADRARVEAQRVLQAAAATAVIPEPCGWSALDRDRASSMADEGGMSAAAHVSEECEDGP